MKIDRHFLLLAMLVGGIEAVAFGSVFRLPAWQDEEHFVETIRLFAREPTLETLRTYPEMNAPLPFVLNTDSVRFFGDDLNRLRCLSLLVALATYGSFYGWLRGRGHAPGPAVVLTLLLVGQPYMLTFSTLVYTDMLAILFLVWACWAISLRQPILLFVGIAGAVLCRQYLAFLALGSGVYLSLRWLSDRQPRDAAQLAAVVLAPLPLVGLFALWQGVCPDCPLRAVYLAGPTRYHPEALTLYLAQLPMYLLPLVIVYWRGEYGWRSLLLGAIAGGAWSWCFPVTVTQAAVAAGLDAAGYLHLLLRAVGGPELAQAGFSVALCFAWPLVWGIARDSVRRWRRGDLDPTLFAALVAGSFLLVMPLSYMAWEKYFMPLVPVLMAEWHVWFRGDRRAEALTAGEIAPQTGVAG